MEPCEPSHQGPACVCSARRADDIDLHAKEPPGGCRGARRRACAEEAQDAGPCGGDASAQGGYAAPDQAAATTWHRNEAL